MIASPQAIARWLLKTVSLAAIWYCVYVANAAIFAKVELNAHASLIFLPAALRVIFPLVFGSAGVFGLILGGYLVLPNDPDASLLHQITLAVLSGITPLLGIYAFKRIFQARTDLADLTPRHLFALSLLCGIANSLILNCYLWATGNLLQPLRQITTIFLGDVFGMMLLLYATSIGLSFLMSKNPSSRR